MKLYITFGQGHTHAVNGKTFDKDCVAVIECNDYEHGRERAFELFDGEFCFSHLEDWCTPENMAYFPRGLMPVDTAQSEPAP